MLSDLVAGALQDASERRAARSLSQVEADALARPAALDALAALAPRDTVRIIAEVKRASPSRGALADIPDPAQLAVAYETGGASAISVLTEGRRFLGTLDDLRAVRAAVDVPVLRKDFIADEYQLLEARAAGADLALLIVAALDQSTLVGLLERAVSIGLTPLVEVHDEEEVERALDAGATLVGVNARNLRTLEVDRSTFERLARCPRYVEEPLPRFRFHFLVQRSVCTKKPHLGHAWSLSCCSAALANRWHASASSCSFV